MKPIVKLSILLILGTLLLAGFANGQTGGPQNSTTVFELPFSLGAVVEVQNPLAGKYPILNQIEMAEIIDDSHKTIKAPPQSQAGPIHSMGQMSLHGYCNDSIPPADCDNWGMILDLGVEYLIVSGLDSAYMAQSGWQVGDTVGPDDTLGLVAPGTPLHMEVYVPGPSGNILQADGSVIRNWNWQRIGRKWYLSDTHNRIPQFCLGGRQRALNHGEVVSVAPCTAAKTVSFEEVSIEPAISLYPQPATDVLKMEIALETSGKYTLEMLDLEGRVLKTVWNGEVLETGTHAIALPVQSFAPGMYFYRLADGHQVHTGKWIIIR